MRSDHADFAADRSALYFAPDTRSDQSKRIDRPMSAPAKQPAQESVRLHVLLARCGLGSRRACEEFIRKGRVSVDGVAVTELGVRVDPASQTVLFDTEPIRPDRPACNMQNKPKGVLCTNSDPAGRTRVIALFPSDAGRLFPIGRLDENSVGLLLVTNDGELSHQLAHPKFQVPKTYHVLVAGIPNGETLKKARGGIYFSDGLFRVDRVKKLKTKGKSTVLEVKLAEGRNREIRRLFARLGHKVMQLERATFGPLELRNVAPGRYRALTKKEMTLLTDYIENGAERRREDATKRPRKKRPQFDKHTKSEGARTVEVAPIENSRRLDITGRRRNRSEVESELDRRESRNKPHPAIAKPAARKKRRR